MKPDANFAELATEKQTDAVICDSDAIERLKHELKTFELTDEARDAQAFEQALSLRDAVRIYRYGMFWSVVFSTAVVMEGYDTALTGSFLAYPQFVQKYGHLQPDGTHVIGASWQSWLSCGSQIGMIFGVMASGWLTDKFGYRKTNIGALTLMAAAIFIPFFAPNIKVLLVGQFVQGLPWGCFQGATCAYAADVAPTALRPVLTTHVNMCWVWGQLLATGVLRALLSRTDQWAYRIPYAIQWIWPLPLIILTIFSPESPYYLIRQHREAEAVAVVKRLTVQEEGSAFSPEASVALMIHTNKLEKAISEGTTFWDCFKGIDRRRTEIACCVYSIQNLCGSSLMGYSNYFLQQAGFSVTDSFDLSLGQYALGLIGTASSWWLMKRVGRRDIYIIGLSVLFTLLMLIGFMGLSSPSNKPAVRTIGAMLLIYTFVYDLTVGPVCYSLVSEMGSTRLRAKTIVLARSTYNVWGFFNFVVMPRFINPTAWNWGAKTGFFWAGMCFLCITYCYFRLPEPRGRTYGELDILFERKVRARDFSETKADPFSIAETTRYDPTTGITREEKIAIEHINFA